MRNPHCACGTDLLHDFCYVPAPKKRDGTTLSRNGHVGRFCLSRNGEGERGAHVDVGRTWRAAAA
eukprot:608079-Rhodomonas_salina.2